MVLDSVHRHMDPACTEAFTNTVLDAARAALPAAAGRTIERLGKRKERQ
jgi:hypothetical protein